MSELFLEISGFTTPTTGVGVTDATASLDIGQAYDLADWSTKAQITTDLPEQVREIPGYAVGTGDLTLASPAGGRFTPRGFTIGHQPVTLDASDGTNTARVFTGKVTGANGAATDLGLSLDLEDNLSSLRGNVDIPAVVATYAQGNLAVGLSPRWVMDAILRQAGYFTTPPMESGCIFSAPLQGSLWPEYPTLTPDKITGNNAFDGSPVDPEFAWSPLGEYLADGHATYRLSPVTWGTDDTLRFCFTLPEVTAYSYLTLATVDGAWSVGVEIGASTIAIVVDGVTEATEALTPGLWCVDIERTSSTGIAYTITNDAGVTESGTATIASTVGVSRAVDVLLFGGIGGAQITLNSPDAATVYTQHVAGTDLSSSLGELTAVPVFTGKAKDVLLDLAAAEFGGFWMSVDGIPTFRNREDLLGVGATPETVTSYTAIADIDWSWSADSVRSAVEIPVTPITVTSGDPWAEGARATAWVADTEIKVPAGGRVTLTVDLDRTVMGVATTIVGTSAAISPASGSIFRANRAADGSGLTTTTGITGRVRQIGPSRLEITFTGGANHVWLVDTNGDPAVTIRCLVAATAGNEQAVTAENTGVDADVLRLDSSVWRQDVNASLPFAVALATQLRTPIATASGIRVVPNVLRRLGDVILLQDPTVTGLNVRCLITGITRAGQAGQLTEYLEVRELPWLISDFNTVYAGQLISDFNTANTGRTIADFNNELLGV